MIIYMMCKSAAVVDFPNMSMCTKIVSMCYMSPSPTHKKMII